MLFRRVLVLFILCHFTPLALASSETLIELDNYWDGVEQSVKEGDFKQYALAYHPDAVLVSGFKQQSYPITQAFERWRPGFADTKSGKMQAEVEFRWSASYYDSSTAHQTGIFKYTSIDEQGEKEVFIAHISVLLVKKLGHWLMMMEYQQGEASLVEFDALKAE